MGPSRAAAALESSKAFAKAFMERHRIPTSRFQVCDTPEAAYAAIASGEFGYPVVLKADGLAAGKGVVIAEDRAAAESAVRATMVDRRFGVAGERLVLEEFLVGEEASYFVLADGTACLPCRRRRITNASSMATVVPTQAAWARLRQVRG